MTEAFHKLVLWLCGVPHVDRLATVEEWHWYSAAQPEAWLVWTVGIVGVLMAVLCLLPRSGLPPRTAGMLFVMRLLAGALLVVLLLQLELRVTMNLAMPPKVAVLTDQSGSMGVTDTAKGGTRLAEARKFSKQLQDELGSDAHVVLRDFGWRLYADTNGTARGGSDFGRSLRELTRAEPDLQAVVVLTDGNEPATQPGWASAAPLLTAQGMRTFPVLFGKGEKPEVLGTRLDGEYYVRIGDELRLAARLDASAFKTNLVASLKLFQKKPPKPGQPPAEDKSGQKTKSTDSDQLPSGKKPVEWKQVHEQKVNLTAGRVSMIPITFKPKVEGRHEFRILVEGVRGQATKKLLESEHTVDVIDRKIRVFYLDIPRDERKLVGHWVARDPVIEMAGLVKLPKGGWYAMGEMRHRNLGKVLPNLEEELNDYDVVILGDIPRGDFSSGTNDETSMVWLADFVLRRGGGLITMGGRNAYSAGTYQDSALAGLLPFSVERKDDAQVEGKFKVLPTPVGYSHPALRLEPDAEGNKRAWQDLPNVEGCNRVGELKPGAQMLALNETEDGPVPAMAYHKIGRGNVLALTVDTTWRWEMQRPRGSKANEETEGTDYFRRFWGNAIRFIAPDPRLQPERPQVSRREKRAEVGRTVTLKTRLVDKLFRPIRNAEIAVHAISPRGKQLAIYPADSRSNPGMYEYALEIDEPGVWEVSVYNDEAKVKAAIAKAEADLEKAFKRKKEDLDVEASGGKDPEYVIAARTALQKAKARVAKETIIAIDSVSEFTDTRADEAAMKKLAVATEGKLFKLNEAAQLAEMLAGLSRNTSRTYVAPIWNLPPAMILFILLVCADCWLRKRRGCA